MLRLWSEIGAATATKTETETAAAADSDPDGRSKIVALLKRTCKIIPDALDSSQKEQL